MNTIGEKIKKLRLGFDWSLDDLAQKSKVSKAYLSQLENGDSEKPSAEVLYRIAVSLETTIANLLGKVMLLDEDNIAIPANLEKAAIEHKIPESYIKKLSAMAQRTKEKKGRKDYSVDDWFYLFQTLERIDKQNERGSD